jgi:hypothetical protein
MDDGGPNSRLTVLVGCAAIGPLAASCAYPPYCAVNEHLEPTVDRRSRAAVTPSPSSGGHLKFIRIERATNNLSRAAGPRTRNLKSERTLIAGGPDFAYR